MAVSVSESTHQTSRYASVPYFPQRITEPLTPTFSRSISSQVDPPGGYREEEILLYELTARYVSSGFAAERRPRCIIRFGPEPKRRAGDYWVWDSDCKESDAKIGDADWGKDYELYRTNVRETDLALMEAKLERALRQMHTDYLQLDTKPRKAVVVVPPLLPRPLLETFLGVLFNHYALTPSVVLFSTPALSVVSSGLRSALVVDIGWEETIVTAVGEFRQVSQRRSTRAGKMLTAEMGKVVRSHSQHADLSFKLVEDILDRLGWCRPHADTPPLQGTKSIPVASSGTSARFDMRIQSLSEPVERVLFGNPKHADDDELPIHYLAYLVLLGLPVDFRAACTYSVVVTGEISQLPGLRARLLNELQALIDLRGWDLVHNYGSAKPKPKAAARSPSSDHQATAEASYLDPQAILPPHQREHDYIKDPITQKAERASTKRSPKPEPAVVRGVETLGAWAGASLASYLRIRGVYEVSKEDFLKHGYPDNTLL
ncbi:actin-like ATPase domain-containing protein [Piedraia hortae CBS 480.64]|uniref:Actin-like ATPase domain-containing protein n=1 Tax=Piedraia hortae CBS 480.64 TaxID=1314780 RepID=A0A6A7CAP0_9PEZI|nr:actin-like ATPase domain-containing protein [Piedraia hortae CBS 480.64]